MTAVLERARPATVPAGPAPAPDDWRRRLRFLWPVAGLGAALGLAIAVATHTTVFLAIGLAVALVTVYAAVQIPLVALVVLQVVAWSNVSTVAGTHHGLSLYLVALAIGVTSVVVAANRGRRQLLGRSPVYLLLALVVTAEGVSLLASPYPLTSLSTPTERLKDVLFFLVTVALIRVSGRVMTAVKVIVVTIAVLAGLTLIQQYLLHNSTTFGGLSKIPVGVDVGSATVRHSGPEGDVNFWGRTIVLVTPLALSLGLLARWNRIRGSSGWRRLTWVAWCAAPAALLGGEYLSQSRGGLIALVVGVVLWLTVAAWQYRRWLILLPVGLILVVAGVPGLATRLGTLTELTHLSANTTDPSLLQRVQAQEVGLAMFRAHPTTGVGVGNFTVVEPKYVDQPGITNTGQIFAAHDLYLEIAAEQGVIGLGAWALFYGGALLVALRAAVLSGQLRDRDSRMLSLGVLFGLAGWAVASITLHLSDLNDLLAMVAVATVIDMNAREAAARRPWPISRDLWDPEIYRPVRRARRAALLAGVSVVGLGAVLMSVFTVFVPLHRSVYQAQATASVGPTSSSASGNNAYAWDTVDRQTLLPTLAAIAANPRFLHQAETDLVGLSAQQAATIRLSVTGDVANAVLRLTVDADNPAVAQQVANSTLVVARTYLETLISVYHINPVTTTSAGKVQQTKHDISLVLAAMGLVTLFAGARVGRRTYRRSLERAILGGPSSPSPPPAPAPTAGSTGVGTLPPEPVPVAVADDAAGGGLTTVAVKGFAWRVGSFGGNRLVVFLSTLALARLLDPHDFGLFAAALTFTQYLEVLLDFGLGSYLIYRQESGFSDQIHVAFTYNLILTGVLTSVAVGLSPLTARLFGAPHQVTVFAAMSGYLLLRGLSQVNQAVIQRDLLFKKQVIIDLGSAVARGGLSIGLALAGYGVWAIVFGFLAGQLVSTVAYWAVVRFRPRLRFNWAVGRSMLQFGVNSVAIDLLTELSLNADYLVVGCMIGTTALGLYTIAYRLPELLINNLFWLFSGVAFPVYARSRLAGMETLRRAMLKALRLTTVYGFASGVGLALVARDATLVLFGNQWHPAIGPMVVISLASALASAAYASGPLFPAIGKPGTLVLVNIPLTVFRVVGFILAAPHGIFWVACVHLFTNAVMIFVRLGIADRVVGTTARQTVGALMPGMAAAAGIAAFALPLRLLLPAGPGALVAIVGAGVLGAVVALAVTHRPLFHEIRSLSRSLVGQA
ncbi:MAG: oligosaccharide flippase family protein [Acidimicrobiales bacterium]|nr:oligosaccharide flippase family protein [Acidimicrobiales bacterium]